MKINKAPKKPNKVIILLVSVFLLAGVITTGALAYFHFQAPETDTSEINDVDYDPPTQGQIEAGEDIKKGTVENDGQTSDTTSVAITAQEYDGSVLRIRTLIETVANNGTCELILEKDGVIVTRTVETQALPSNSTCKGFDIPVSELSSGVWKVTIKVDINNLKATVTNQVTI